MSRAFHATGALLAVTCIATAQAPSCAAAPGSLTPESWKAPMPVAAAGASRAPLALRRELPLPGPANRFDYQTIDAAARRLYMNHMNAGVTLAFDLERDSIIGSVSDVPRATGVLVVPERRALYISAAGAHEVAAVDARTLSVVARVGGITFPDGIAYAPAEGRVFVSDERGGADVVIDAATNAKLATIDLGGEAGNTHYDSVSHCILVAVQTRDQLVAIDPAEARVVQRYDLPGAKEPHGFTIDEAGRLAFISCQGNAKLIVLDLRTMKVLRAYDVGSDPDVLAWDAEWRRLYVATEGGVMNAFLADGATLVPIGDIRAPHAHTVSVDPRTHRVFLPLENIDGRPVLRIYAPQ